MISKHFILSTVMNNNEELQFVSIPEENQISSEQEVHYFNYHRYGKIIKSGNMKELIIQTFVG